MPLQKSGSRFKQMVSHRESNSADGSFECDRNTNNRQPESFFWISENPKSDIATVRRNTAVMIRKEPRIRNDSNQTAHSPSSPLQFDFAFNGNSASGSVDGGVVGGHGSESNMSTPSLTKVESRPIGYDDEDTDLASLSSPLSLSKRKRKSKSCAVPVPVPVSMNDNIHYHYPPQTIQSQILTPPKDDSGDARVATLKQTCSKNMVFSENPNPPQQHQQAASNLRLHSNTREAQATLSDNKLMEWEGSDINLFHNPNLQTIPVSLFNNHQHHLINDKGNPAPTVTISTNPTTTTTSAAAPKTLAPSTRSYERFTLKSKDKDKDKSFLHLHHSNPKKAIATSASCSNAQKMVEFTDDVEQLIKETDEAFQAVGFALDDAKAVSRRFQQFNSRNIKTTDTIHTINTINRRQTRVTGSDNNHHQSIARSNSLSNRYQVQMQDSNFLKEHSSSSSGLSGKAPVPNSIIASKAKKSKSNSPKQKKVIRSDKASRKSLPHPHSSARWNLGDVTASMADVFKGKFTRLEADEMLTPDRLQQLEEKAKLDNERKVSLENAQIEAARNVEAVKDVDGLEKSQKVDGERKLDTNIGSSDNPNNTSPTEPFHLENLLPHINHDKSSTLPLASLINDNTESPSTGKYQQTSRKTSLDAPNPDYAEIDAIEQAFQDLNFPSPPRDSPPRLPRSRSNTGLASLPTISEISPLDFLSPRTPKRTFSQDSEYSQDSSVSSVDYIQLPSTPYTLTSPLFRHGPIRLEQTYSRSRRDSLSAPELEEALDWTAFQMAISGTMDDGTLGASEESIWEADEAEIDSILDWWTGFGYPGIGRLVKEAPISRRKRGKSQVVESPGAEANRKNREARDHRATTIGLGLGFGGSLASSSSTIDPQPSTPSSNPGRWIETQRNVAPQVVGEESIARWRRDTTCIPSQMRITTNAATNIQGEEDDDSDSLPPSPINLVKIKDEYIPMGYNLGHDLGDFLNWETYHVQSLSGEDEGWDGERRAGRGTGY